MAVDTLDAIFLDDQYTSIHQWTRQLLGERSSKCPNLSAFVAGVSDILRLELADLPLDQQRSLPSFSTLITFYDEYSRQNYQLESINSSILCFGQLSHWIRLCEEMPQAISENRCIIGQGLGLIAASAISTFVSVSSLIPVALAHVRLAFKVGKLVDEVSQRINGQIGGVWSKKVSKNVRVELEQFIQTQQTESIQPVNNLAYISSVSSSEMTVSGLPSVLEDLFSSNQFQQHFIRDCEAAGLYGVPHAYSSMDLETCIAPLKGIFKDLQMTRPVISTHGTVGGGDSKSRTLPEQLLEHILCKPAHFDLLLDESNTITSYSDLRLVPIGPCSNTQDIASGLSEQGLNISIFQTSYESMFHADNATSSTRDKIAIVGMSGRFPGGQNTEEFWNMLLRGLDMHTEVPPDRFDAQAHYDPSGKGRNKSHTPFGCFVRDAGLFDPRFFNMSPREAAQTDPMQRLAIITAYEALEMSGYVANRTASTKLDRIGTFYGQTSDDWREINEAQDIDTYFITGGVRAFGPGRINYFFKFSGPSYSIDTACSSSMAALQIACTALRARECDTAVAGGLNILTNPDIFAGLSKGQFLSKTGNCQTFDNAADGYCRGDGIGTVILKRMEDAIADNDNILATILATATNHSAEAVSITHPHAATQERLYNHILNQAGVDPLEIGYVEMHGTGTQAGDAMEMTSVLNAFAPRSRQREAHQPLYLGSVKSNIGHGEAASGVCALIKVLLMLKYNTIPPHCGIKDQINQTFPKDMAARRIYIPKMATQFHDYESKRTIYISNFSAAGGNSGMLLRGPDPVSSKGEDSRKSHVVAVSARALSSLHSNLKSLNQYLDLNPSTSLADIGYTTTARRTHHNYKISFNVSSISKLRDVLVNTSDKTIEPTATSPQIIFTFTGQGSHYLGLANELYHSCTKFRLELQRANFMALTYGFPSFLELVEGNGAELKTMSATLIQIALVSVQIALCELWKSWDILPEVVIGHSLGEYGALYAAGVMSASEVIYLVGKRASLLEKHCKPGTHAMLAVQARHNTLDEILQKHHLEIACLNSPSEIVLSGTDHDIEAAKESMSATGIRCKKLDVSYAFHSAQVDTILPEFKCIAAKMHFRTPKIPILSSLFGGPMIEAISPDYLCDHARKTVNFCGALKTGKSEGLINANSVFIEIGPQPITLGFVKTILGTSTLGTCSLNNKDPNWTTIAGAASLLYNNGARINWQEYHRQFEHDLTLLDLPAYSWALKNYWIDYVNNWCLTKGGELPTMTAQEPPLSTTTVQSIKEEKYTENEGRLVAESDIHRPDMFAAISGHRVNGTPLCPSSLYGDVAITIGSYMHKKLWKDTHENLGRLINVRNMEVPKPLIAKPGTDQTLRIEAEANKGTNSIKLSFLTGVVEHAHCIVEFEDKYDQEFKWSRAAYLVTDRVKAIRASALAGEAHTLLSGMAYKLFASLVDYEPPYRGMKRVIFNADQFEASADISLYAPTENEHFICAPYWLDSVGHLAGFCVNATDAESEQEHVYISHGWESLRLSEQLLPNKSYRTYVRMLPGGNSIMVGDVYLFEEEKVIGLFGGLKFQRIPRRVLDIMLPPAVVKGSRQPAASDATTVVKQKVVETITDKKTSTKLTIQETVTVTSQVMDIVAEECGVALTELADSNNFSDLGVDSLMQLAIGGRIREHVGLDIHSTLFVDYPTISALKEYLVQFESIKDPSEDSDISDSERRLSVESPSMSSSSATPLSEAPLFDSEHHVKLKDAIIAMSAAERTKPVRKAQSFILSGSIKTATRNFFMMPDGGGAAISYMHIPPLGKGVCVFGLNSPFMECPEEYNCGVSGIARAFIEEMRRRQPSGPYEIGGWSAGGVIAFEVVQQLIKANQEVSNLILIDSPSPLIIEPLPSTLHAWFNSIGLIGDPNNPGSTKVPPWLLPHFSSTIQALSSYNARRLMLYNTGLPIPKVTAIWCQDGICHDKDAPRPDPYPYGHAQWLLEDKDDFADGGWDAFFQPGTVEGRVIPGNHFTMMRGDNVRLLGEEIKRALGLEL